MIDDSKRRQFRDAMARLAAAVNIITTDGPHGRCGITASAVCSVTDAPPTMLVCVNRSSGLHDVLLGNGRACINVLAAAQTEMARLFAGRTGCEMAERFHRCDWRSGRLGTPILAGAVTALEGRIVDSKILGSHSVVFIEIDEIAIAEPASGLVYFDRLFHPLRSPDALPEVV